MIEIGSFEAKTHFSDLLKRVSLGEEFIVTMRGKPIARLLHAEENNDPAKMEALLARLAAFRAEVSNGGSLLKPGETFKDWAREGLKW